MPKRKTNPKRILDLQSKIWFWSLFAGGFFAIGYSLTKNLLISTISHKDSIQQDFYESNKNRKMPDSRVNLTKENYKKTNPQSENNPVSKEKLLKQKIRVHNSNDSYIKISIYYSENQDLKKLAVFKKNLSFFQKENVQSLMKSLNDPQKN